MPQPFGSESIARWASRSWVPQITPAGNVFFYDPHDHRKVTKGDVDAAFEKADVIVQGTYRPAAIEQAPTETQAFTRWAARFAPLARARMRSSGSSLSDSMR